MESKKITLYNGILYILTQRKHVVIVYDFINQNVIKVKTMTVFNYGYDKSSISHS